LTGQGQARYAGEWDLLRTRLAAHSQLLQETQTSDQLLEGVKLGDQIYKNHLDRYNQLDLLLGKAPSARHELFYFGGPKLGAIRIDEMKFQFYQQPYGWPGEKVTTAMPTIVNLRQDPFERTPLDPWRNPE
jgi:hypothetical protein